MPNRSRENDTMKTPEANSTDDRAQSSDRNWPLLHTMRHFSCSNAIEAGCDFKVIAEWLGHKDGGVLVAMTYGHLRSEHSAAMAKRLTFDAQSETLDDSKVVKNKQWA